MKQQQKQKGLTVFISYERADQAMCDQLAIHLSQLKRDGLIEAWSDQQILAGSDRAHAINQALHSAQIILLLISANFLASHTCYDLEMQQALEHHREGKARVIPILVRPCDWQHSPLVHLQCLPRNTKPMSTWDNPDEAFLSIVEELRPLITLHPFSDALLRATQQHRMHLLKRVYPIWVKGIVEHLLHQFLWSNWHLQEQRDILANP